MGKLGPGTYLLHVTSALMTAPQEGRDPQLAVAFEDANGDYITWFSGLGMTKKGFSEKAFAFAADQLKGLGWIAEERGYRFEDLNEPWPSGVLGREASVVIRNEPYDGEDQIKVAFINDPSSPKVFGERMDAEHASAFGDKLRTELAKAGKNMPAVMRPFPAQAFSPETLEKARAAQAALAGSPPLDDLPF